MSALDRVTERLAVWSAFFDSTVFVYFFPRPYFEKSSS